MHQGNGDIENVNSILQIEGVEIAKEFIAAAAGTWVGRKSYCRLQLPNKWCDDFSGFLICAVFSHNHFTHSNHIRIRMKSSGSSSEDDDNIKDNDHNDVSWKEDEFEGDWTWVGYVSFASLNHTLRWDRRQTYTTLSFTIPEYYCRGFGVRLVGRKTTGPTPTPTAATASSQFSHQNSDPNTPDFFITQETAHALDFFFGIKQNKIISGRVYSMAELD